MKRLLLAVFAAAVTAAWAVPSTAADFTFSGQYRLRGERRNNADFRKDANDSRDWWIQRLRLTTSAKATDDTSVKVTLQDTRSWGFAQAGDSGPALSDSAGSNSVVDNNDQNNTVDLHEAYVNIDKLFGAPVSLRAGRQELAYGDERLIGAFGWSNFGRSFDALKVVYTSDAFNIDAFTSKINENSVLEPTATGVAASGESRRDQDFYGVYATIKSIPNNTLDVYALLLKDGGNLGGTNAFGFGSVLGNTAVGGTITEAQKLYTYGVRLKGAASGADYTVELPFQTGSVKTTTQDYKLKGRALAVKAGYTIPNTPKVRVGVEYNQASGDDDTTDDKIKTFFNLFPTNHDKLGYMDQQAWRNTKSYNVNVSAEPTEKLRLYASYWKLKLDKTTDDWYGAGSWNGAPVGGIRNNTAGSTSKDAGTEIDLVATYKYNSAVTAELGYGLFNAGSYVKDNITGTQEKGDQTWSYLMLTTNF